MKIIGSVYEHNSIDRWLNVRVKNLEELKTVLQEYPNEDKFVFWMGVNNVTGEIFDIKTIGNIAHKYNAFYVCDATALFGHASIPQGIDKWCDCIIQSSHKIGTELGIGAMWLSTKFNDWLGDFKLYGTPNVAGALTTVAATEDVMRNIKNNLSKYNKLYDTMLECMGQEGIDFKVINDGDKTPAIQAIQLQDISADALQQYLASKDIFIGIGDSTCATSHNYRVLTNGYGLTVKGAEQVVRISFSEDSTEDEVICLVKEIAEFKRKFID